MESINDKGYYVGPEVQWNTEDVEAVAVSNFDLHLSQEDLKRVLIASIQDNEWLMEKFRDTISDTIRYMMDNGELKGDLVQVPTCLQWNKIDIQAQGVRQGLKVDDTQAQELLNGFFKQANDHITETINNAMAEYVRENHKKQ